MFELVSVSFSSLIFATLFCVGFAAVHDSARFNFMINLLVVI